MAALQSLLAVHGVLTPPPASLPPVDSVPFEPDEREQLASRFVPPDSPPPRA